MIITMVLLAAFSYSKPSFAVYYDMLPESKNNTSNYDLYMAYSNVPYINLLAFAYSNGELPDIYNKPNHPTFSDSSIYSTKDNPGGWWTSDDEIHFTFYATRRNVANVGTIAQYRQWFAANETDCKLIIVR
jgi:hypothetical protein